MDIRQIHDGYAVSPQITTDDIPALKDAGFTTVICNRPDSEVTPDLGSDAIRAACEAAGLGFAYVPVTHAGFTHDLIINHAAAMDASAGPVFAYCRSGTRSCHVWALGQAGALPTDEIIEAGARGGYDLSPLRGFLSQQD
ncbi:TIGR01244 family sulfur transferase [Palleronia caenipelagi]|uniref:TIGR01244 family phosphatase n=1 Tax=Palleronia caenipelagi TaxID=2489174 RepID=A0A547PTE5_9RHOB|nr:TIGR01244 family sulfur transferase [Palleronia caenipelagi]TRD17361.1 TIGR01244 family phosphatase [Palleronia caenipelagi]